MKDKSEMSRERKYEQERHMSMRTIHRLGNCEGISKADEPGPHIREFAYADPNFEIGEWEPVPVEKTSRKPRRHRAERKPHEPIDYDNIDYTSHLTPKIENIKPFVERPRKPRWLTSEYDGVLFCFCTVCLLRWDLCDELPNHMIVVTECCKASRLFQVEDAAETLFKILRHKMFKHSIPNPVGLSHLKCNYRLVLKFFERHCRRDAIDIGIVLNDYVVQTNIRFNLKIEKRLHSVFKAFVYACAAQILYNHLEIYLTPHELNRRGYEVMERFRMFNPQRFLALPPNRRSNIAKNFIRLYSS